MLLPWHRCLLQSSMVWQSEFISDYGFSIDWSIGVDLGILLVWLGIECYREGSNPPYRCCRLFTSKQPQRMKQFDTIAKMSMGALLTILISAGGQYILNNNAKDKCRLNTDLHLIVIDSFIGDIYRMHPPSLHGVCVLGTSDYVYRGVNLVKHSPLTD